MKKKEKKNWMQDAVKVPGSLRAAAEKEGAINEKGNIDKAWIGEKSKDGGKTGKRAKLAETFRKNRGK